MFRETSLPVAEPTTLPETPIADILDAAADRLERTGWCKFRMGAPEGPNCAKGAIYYESGATNIAFCPYDFPVFPNSMASFYRTVFYLEEENLHNRILTDWNDEQLSSESVIQQFRNAAEKARRERR